MSMVKLVNVKKSFGSLEVLKGIDFEVASGCLLYTSEALRQQGFPDLI